MTAVATKIGEYEKTLEKNLVKCYFSGYSLSENKKDRGIYMSTTKKPAKTQEELQSALQELIAQGRKDGMVPMNDLNALLEKMELSTEKIEEIVQGLVHVLYLDIRIDMI